MTIILSLVRVNLTAQPPADTAIQMLNKAGTKTIII